LDYYTIIWAKIKDFERIGDLRQLEGRLVLRPYGAGRPLAEKWKIG
jgi:hypothetical protein